VPIIIYLKFYLEFLGDKSLFLFDLVIKMKMFPTNSRKEEDFFK